MPNDIIQIPIPITPPGPNWPQREYVACLSTGVGFAADDHSTYTLAFHYAFAPDKRCRTVIVSSNEVVRHIHHEHRKTLDWIEKSRQAMEHGA